MIVGGAAARRAFRRRRLLGAGAIVAGFAAGALLPASRPLPFDLCLWHALTGLDCLTCGLTRAFCHFVQGEARMSLAMHPAGALVALGLAGALAWTIGEAAAGRPLVRASFRGRGAPWRAPMADGAAPGRTP